MIRYSLLLLRGQRLRLSLTIGGIALSLLLMGFLVAVYRGVAEGSVAYIRDGGADLWVVQQHTTNILRGFSVLTRSHGMLIGQVPGVTSVSPILFRLSSLETDRGPATLYLAGIEPESPLGAPPHLVAGRMVADDHEIVLDRAFASAWGLPLGRRVRIQDADLTIVGLTEGTNMFVIQYGFTTMSVVRDLYGSNDLVAAYLIAVTPGEHPHRVASAIVADVPGIAVYPLHEFVENNLREMRTGFLPILLVLSLIGAVSLSAVVSLLLTVTVLERRRDLAVLKASGAPTGFLPLVVAVQSLELGCLAYVAAAAAFPVLASVVAWLAPQVGTIISPLDALTVGGGLVIVCLAASLLPVQRLRTIHPSEAFL